MEAAHLQLARLAEPSPEPGHETEGLIDVVATTMSGSIEDQLKVGRIGPEFRLRTTRPVRVHTAHTHAEAQALAHDAVRRGGRLLVSRGSGKFKPPQGAHLDGRVPRDLRGAWVRRRT